MKSSPDKKTELEIEVQACFHMRLNLLNLENLGKFSINLERDDATKINIGSIRIISPENVVCKITGEPCALYTPGKGIVPRINYHYLTRCPSSKDSIKKYELKGMKRGSLFYASEAKEIKE